MNNRILLIGGNFYPEPTGIGKYSGEMIDWLSENGYECTVITTFPYYPDWKVQPEYRKSRFLFKKETKCSEKPGSIAVTTIRCPHYIPTSPTGIKRLLSEFTISFFCYIALFFLFFTRKFNYVITVAPPFELGLLGVLYKKIKGAVFIYHIQDLQVDAARDLGMIKSSLVLKAFSSLEKYIIRNADYISTISEGMINKVKSKCDREVIYFPNWVDTNIFKPVPDKASIKLLYGFKSTDKIFLYSGAIGVKQGLEFIIHVAKDFENLEHVKFVICGSGPYKGHLVTLKNTLQLQNVIFLPLQPHKDFNTFLNMADFHLVLQKANASDLVMPSKLSTILAVGGIPIVTANQGTSLYEIMNSSDMGILVEPENQESLKNAIYFGLSLHSTAKECNARDFAENNLSKEKILSRFASNILNGKEQSKQELLPKKKAILIR